MPRTRGLAIGQILIGLSLVPLAGCGTEESSQSDGKEASARSNGQCPHSDFFLFESITPAEIVQDDDPAHGETRPAVNYWRTATRRRYTLVFAGGTREDGEFVINRQLACRGPRWARQHNEHVRIPGAGRLKITKAPLGPKVVGWAQRRGELEFTSKSGISGTLYLRYSGSHIRLNEAG